MSYDHIRAVATNFHGHLAERMVLFAFATHVNPQSGFSTISVAGVARFCGLQRSYAQRIVRRLEGSIDATAAEPGKWLYPLNRQSQKGDGQATCYRMFTDAYTAPKKRRKANNPTGLNTPVPGSQEPTPVPGLQEPTHGSQEPTTVPGFQEPPRGSPESPTWVPVTSRRGFQEPTKALKASKEHPATPKPADDLKAYTAYLRTIMKSGGEPLTLADWRRQGASPPHPPDPTKDMLRGEKDNYPPGYVQTTLDDLIEPTMITDHQEVAP